MTFEDEYEGDEAARMDRKTRYGASPLIAAAEAIYQLEGHGVGGCLHVYLEDGNCTDGVIDFCLNQANETGCAPCADLSRRLLAVTEEERRAVYELIEER